MFRSFLAGISVGAVSILLLRKKNDRLKQENQVERLANHITKQLKLLEDKVITKQKSRV